MACRYAKKEERRKRCAELKNKCNASKVKFTWEGITD
jgi:hypothetical protein